jgi:hypothetical protein
MKKEEILKSVDYLIVQGQAVLGTKQYSEFGGSYIDYGKQLGFRTASLSLIRQLYKENHIFYKDFEDRVRGQGTHETEIGINILQSIRHEIENGWLLTIKELVSAEIFSDFLEMSKYLLDNNYKDAAAVMIGSVLEEHLRMLCGKYNVPVTIEKSGEQIPKKTDLLNSDLVKADVYGVLVQKNITAWLDLRNRAAHGKYDEYKKENVDLMHQGVLNFIMTTK